jgi:hypothetical protein
MDFQDPCVVVVVVVVVVPLFHQKPFCNILSKGYGFSASLC